MEEWHRQYPEEQSKAVEQSMKRIAARREQVCVGGGGWCGCLRI